MVDLYGGPPVDYEEIVTIKLDGSGERVRVVNALIEASSHWPPRLECIES